MSQPVDGAVGVVEKVEVMDKVAKGKAKKQAKKEKKALEAKEAREARDANDVEKKAEYAKITAKSTTTAQKLPAGERVHAAIKTPSGYIGIHDKLGVDTTSQPPTPRKFLPARPPSQPLQRSSQQPTVDIGWTRTFVHQSAKKHALKGVQHVSTAEDCRISVFCDGSAETVEAGMQKPGGYAVSFNMYRPGNKQHGQRVGVAWPMDPALGSANTEAVALLEGLNKAEEQICDMWKSRLVKLLRQVLDAEEALLRLRAKYNLHSLTVEYHWLPGHDNITPHDHVDKICGMARRQNKPVFSVNGTVHKNTPVQYQSSYPSVRALFLQAQAGKQQVTGKGAKAL
ncbi:hypothetical protein B0T21DRAFT_393381 [Apiosordaria backusii]|uniref:RNase H type-1 domain-containing protein n=1 Tax=Apiosordaria backusii TaxID=314023 RepID=A0AA40BM61_9PEZI|nr:hypothetical protein B0T21DRAFT_393381 [Apiosordaria backusii]